MINLLNVLLKIRRKGHRVSNTISDLARDIMWCRLQLNRTKTKLTKIKIKYELETIVNIAPRLIYVFRRVLPLSVAAM